MAGRPTKGAAVLAKGRSGIVLEDHPEDAHLTYKVKFHDDHILPHSDWFAQADVVEDGSKKEAEAAAKKKAEEEDAKAKKKAEEDALAKQQAEKDAAAAAATKKAEEAAAAAAAARKAEEAKAAADLARSVQKAEEENAAAAAAKKREEEKAATDEAAAADAEVIQRSPKRAATAFSSTPKASTADVVAEEKPRSATQGEFMMGKETTSASEAAVEKQPTSPTSPKSAEQKVDPDNGKTFTFEELQAFYKSKYNKKEIDEYWKFMKPVGGVNKKSAKGKAKK